MANFIALCYATAKKAGIDTNQMTPDEVVEWYNKQQKTSQAKGKATKLIKEYVGASNPKEGTSTKIENVEKIEQTTNNFNSDEKFKEYFVEKIDIHNEQELEFKQQEYLNRISKEKVEHNIVIDKNGNVFETSGDETYVDDMGLDMDGAIDIHNHPNQVKSFSKDDFIAISKNPNTKFILVDNEFTYEITTLKKIDKPFNYFYINADPTTPVSEIKGDLEEKAYLVMEKEGYIKFVKNRREKRS